MSASRRSSMGARVRLSMVSLGPTLALAASCLLAPAPARSDASPVVAARVHLPPFRARDLSGRGRSASELGGRRTLLIVVADPDAGNAAERWAQSVRAAGTDVADAMFTVVALRLPFFVPDGLVLDRARARTPSTLWTHTWVDRDGSVLDALGLRGAATPYVYVLDRDGSIRARMQSDADPVSVRNALALLRD